MTQPIKHYEFKAQLFQENTGPAVILKQTDGWSEEGPQAVILHSDQLRAVCNEFGILADDGEALKKIATLQRRMLVLCERIGDLEDYMVKFSDHKHADLTCEMTKLGALADLAIEWCADFEPQTQEPAQITDAPITRTSEAPAGQGSATQSKLI